MSVNFECVCRLCLSSRGELSPIFPTTSVDDSGPAVLATKIKDCVSVNINENDELPTNVCRKCLDNVNNWHTFKEICEKAQNKLLSLKNDVSLLEEVKLKDELCEETYDDAVAIDGSYPDFEQNVTESNKLQPEGPPILASLGLTPRSDKGGESEREDGDINEYDEDLHEQQFAKVPSMPEVSITVMRPSGETLHARQGIQQLASKDCLVCGRSYRYSHNARRHELNSHNFDRYTNKVVQKKPKLRPNPFNPKARLMPNSGNRMHMFSKTMPSKMVPHKVIPQPKPIPIKPIQNSLPYPLRIKALKDLQIKKKEPQILKTLLTSKPEILVSEPEILNSEPGSPETLISEPEIASFQVETILSEPDCFDHPIDDDEMNGDGEMPKIKSCGIPDAESETEMEKECQDGDENATTMKGDDLNEDVGRSNASNKLSDNDNNNDDNEAPNDALKEKIKEEVQHDDQNQEIDNSGDDGGQHKLHGEQTNSMYDGECDGEEALVITPVVEIKEEVNANDDVDENYEDTGDVGDIDDTAAVKEEEVDPNKVFITKTQYDFISKYRNIIEQVNTQRCLCCNKVYARRKQVIQHLQKNGYKVPKHTCYNCVNTFSHLGALLSHIRTNACTNLWRVIYNENGVTEDMIAKQQENRDPKFLYKDLFNARSYACKICHCKFQLKQFIIKHILEVHEDGQSMVPLVCVHCRTRFKDRTLWKKHTRKGECIIAVACDMCSMKFQTVHEHNEHVMSVHVGDTSQNYSNQAKNVDDRPTDCSICGKSISNYATLVRHLRTIHGEEKPHCCRHCDSKFEHADELDQHVFSEHSDKTLSTSSDYIDTSLVKEEVEEYHYSCTECNAIFETVDAWTDHQVDEHNQIAHHCDQCEKKFLRPSELAEHKNTHLRVKFYPCTFCPDSYNTPQKLSEHMKQSHPGELTENNVEFSCDICVRDFKSRQAYSNHMRIHAKVPTTNRKPGETKGFSPQIIGKPIKQFSLPGVGNVPFLKTNMTVPSAPYSCDICGKGFMHKKNIWKHKKVLHADIIGEKNNESEEYVMPPPTEEDDFNYDENGIGLSTPQFNSFNFANFGNTQQDTVQYTCELCYKKFPLKSSLWKHKRAKHGITCPSSSETQTLSNVGDEGRRSSCTICKITFTDKKSYYRHRKNVHKSNVQMCKICGKPLNSTLELYEHLKAAHARELLGYNANQGSSKQETPKEESEMDGDFETNDPPAEYQAHYPCDTCGKQFVGLLALQNHQCLNQSSQPQTFDCEICHKSYTSIAALKSHRGWHLRSPDGKAAANNSGLWMPQHKVTSKVSKHEVVDASQLARVSMPTNVKRKLPPEVEVTVVNPNKKLKSDDADYEPTSYGGPEDKYCKICDKEFTKRAAFQRHMDEVHQPNSVFCPVCDKSFTRKWTLLVHMKKHYGEEEGAGSAAGSNASPTIEEDGHSCDLCGAQYHSAKALKAHRARHHGEESAESEEDGSVPPPGEFTCAQCGDGVASPRDLIAHRTMHCTPSKFFCNVCRVFFSSGNNLATHTRARHSEIDKSLYPCAMCDRIFTNKKHLQRHIETSH